MKAWTQLLEPGPALTTLCIIVMCLVARVTAAPTLPDQSDAEQSTDIEYYPVADATGCYYNFQHYDEGDRIITNEPCLNCTCHDQMLMCYLRVCPFTKAIGANCKVEKRPDQCCPIITCPEVPVQLVTSTILSTAVGHLGNEYGCSIDGLFYSDGARVPSNPENPCELCYCIRNKTACVMQECTLNVDGCRPVFQEGVCCPVRYNCEHPEYLEGPTTPLITSTTTTTTTTTTTEAPTTTLQPSYQCQFRDQKYNDGELVKNDIPCEKCYCLRGDIVCAVQECGPTPLDKVNCTALPVSEGQCCPDTYDCAGVIEEELTTLSSASYEIIPTTVPGVHKEIRPAVTEVAFTTVADIRADVPTEGAGEEGTEIPSIVTKAAEELVTPAQTTEEEAPAILEESSKAPEENVTKLPEFIEESTETRKQTEKPEIEEVKPIEATTESIKEEPVTIVTPQSPVSEKVEEISAETPAVEEIPATTAGPIELITSRVTEAIESITSIVTEAVEAITGSSTEISEPKKAAEGVTESAKESSEKETELPHEETEAPALSSEPGSDKSGVTPLVSEKDKSEPPEEEHVTTEAALPELIPEVTTIPEKSAEPSKVDEEATTSTEYHSEEYPVAHDEVHDEEETHDEEMHKEDEDGKVEEQETESPILEPIKPHVEEESAVTTSERAPSEVGSQTTLLKTPVTNLPSRIPESTEEGVTEEPIVSEKCDKEGCERIPTEPVEIKPTVLPEIKEKVTTVSAEASEEPQTEAAPETSSKIEQTEQPVTAKSSQPKGVEPEKSTESSLGEHSPETEPPKADTQPTEEEELIIVTELPTRKTEFPESMDHVSETVLATEAPKITAKSTTETATASTSTEGPDAAKVQPTIPGEQPQKTSPIPEEETKLPEFSIEAKPTEHFKIAVPTTELPKEEENEIEHDDAGITGGEEEQYSTQGKIHDSSKVTKEQPTPIYVEPEVTKEPETIQGGQATEAPIVPEVCTSESDCAPPAIPSLSETESPTEVAKPEKESEMQEGTTESNKIPEEHTEETNEIPESGTEEISKQPPQEEPTEAPAKEGETTEEGSGSDLEITTPSGTIHKLAEPEITQLPEEMSTKVSLPSGFTEKSEEAIPTESRLPETTEYPEESELPDREIPGEGNCLVDGQTYKNNSSVPPLNHCQTSCKCVSSILRCESIDCDPPPAGLQNCLPIFPTHESCCPTYSCAGPEVASSMETESPIEITTFVVPEKEPSRPVETEPTQGPEEFTTAFPVEVPAEEVEETTALPEMTSVRVALPEQLPTEVTSKEVEKEVELPIEGTPEEASTPIEAAVTEEVKSQPEELATPVVEEAETGEPKIPEKSYTTISAVDLDKSIEAQTAQPGAEITFGPIIEETSTKNETAAITPEEPEIITKVVPEEEQITELPEVVAGTEEKTQQPEEETTSAIKEVTELPTHLVPKEPAKDLQAPTEATIEQQTLVLPEQPVKEGEVAEPELPQAPEKEGEVTEVPADTKKAESEHPEVSEKEDEITEVSTDTKKTELEHPKMPEKEEEITETPTDTKKAESEYPQVPEKEEEVTEIPTDTKEAESEHPEEPEKEEEVPTDTKKVEPVYPQVPEKEEEVTEIPTDTKEAESEHPEEPEKEEEVPTDTKKVEPEYPQVAEKEEEVTEIPTDTKEAESEHPEVPEKEEDVPTDTKKAESEHPEVPEKEEEVPTDTRKDESEHPEVPKEQEEVPIDIKKAESETEAPKEGLEPEVSFDEQQTISTDLSEEEPVVTETGPKERETEQPPSVEVVDKEGTVAAEVISEGEEVQPTTPAFVEEVSMHITEEEMPTAKPMESESHVTLSAMPAVETETKAPGIYEVTTLKGPVTESSKSHIKGTEPTKIEDNEIDGEEKHKVTEPVVEATTPSSKMEKSPSSPSVTEESGTHEAVTYIIAQTTPSGEEKVPSSSEILPESLTESSAIRKASSEAETEKVIMEGSSPAPQEEITVGTTAQVALEEITTAEPSQSDKHETPEITEQPAEVIIQKTEEPTIPKEKETTVNATISEEQTTSIIVSPEKESEPEIEGTTEIISAPKAHIEPEQPATELPVSISQSTEVAQEATTISEIEESEEEETSKAVEQQGKVATTELPSLVEGEQKPQEVDEHIPEEDTITVLPEERPMEEEKERATTVAGETEESGRVGGEEKPTEKEPIATVSIASTLATETEQDKMASEEEKKPGLVEESQTSVPAETEQSVQPEEPQTVQPEEEELKPVQLEDHKTEAPAISEEEKGIVIEENFTTSLPAGTESFEPATVLPSSSEVPLVFPVTSKPLEEVPAFTSPEQGTQAPGESVSIPGRVGGELFTSGPKAETTTQEHIPGELSTSAPSYSSTEPTTILPATTSTEYIPPSHIPGEQAPEPSDYEQPGGGADEYEDEEQTSFGPGTCRYGGKVYVSAQQIPRDDPCDFCFCFRSDIICLQQSCPPPIPRCHEEPIRGFCCPRYECPVNMATSVNITTSTTTTTTTLPPHFLAHAYKGRASKTGCQIAGKAYKVGEVIRSTSGPCLHCTCGGDGQMKCDPKPCSPEPMLRQMIAAAALRRRR